MSDGFISPLDLVEIGLVTREEAEELHALEAARPHRAGSCIGQEGQSVRSTEGRQAHKRRIARRRF
jgi:hypothetical protein